MSELLKLIAVVVASLTGTAAFVGWFCVFPTIGILWSIGWLK